MLLRHLYERELAQASYLVGCQATGEALVVDPNRDIEQYIALAKQRGTAHHLRSPKHIFMPISFQVRVNWRLVPAPGYISPTWVRPPGNTPMPPTMGAILLQ